MKIEHIISELGPARKTKATATTAATPQATAPATPKPRVRKTATTAATPQATAPATPKPRVRKTTATTAATPQATAPAVAPVPTSQVMQVPAQSTLQKSGVGSQIATGVGRFVQGTGNLASQVASAVTQPVGAAFGGLKKGFRTANRGEVFKLPQSGGYRGASDEAPQERGTGITSDDLNDLKLMIQRLDQRLTNAGIKETKKV